MSDFTSWSDLREAIKDAIANSVTGDAMVGSFTKGERKLEYRSYEDLVALYSKTFTLERLDTIGTPQNTVTYGSFRRF